MSWCVIINPAAGRAGDLIARVEAETAQSLLELENVVTFVAGPYRSVHRQFAPKHENRAARHFEQNLALIDEGALFWCERDDCGTADRGRRIGELQLNRFLVADLSTSDDV